MISWTRLLCVGASLALFASAPAAALSLYDDLVVFGDSLVDAGNVAVVTGGATPNPALGYYAGRFSNGPVASDVLNQAIEGTLSAPSLLGGDNYAFGGARAVDNGDTIPDLAAQVGSYLTNTGGAADANTLYLINVGGNDVFDILNGADALTRINAVVTEIVTQISVLSFAGAQHFLVAGVGNVGGTPGVIAVGPAAEAAGLAASQNMTAALFGALPAGVATVDVIALFDAVNADPTAYGLPAGIDIVNDCLSSGVADPGGPPTCQDFAFFDQTHPTGAVSAILGDAFVAAVPEPGTGLLLALGLVGVALRRRARPSCSGMLVTTKA